MPKITAYALHNYAVTIRPAPVQRAWLVGQQDTDLALQTASANGWDLLCPYSFEAVWSGGPRPEDVEISASGFVSSRLGHGILSFDTGYLFQIEEGHNLWVRGPINYPKDGLYPLDRIIETQGLPCHFSLNWKFTRANQVVRFEKGEPFGTILPYPQNYIENFEGEIKKAADQPRIYAAYQPGEELSRSVLAEEAAAAKQSDQAEENYPPLSCICLTYGRPELLEEAIYSFLQQDYAGPKELIVVNDFQQQVLEFDHPEVQVINFPKRFYSLGEKYKAAVALGSYDLIFVWQDDDIYLPQRLSWAVDRFDPQKGFLKPGQAWFWDNGQLSSLERNVFHGGSCWSRDLFNAVRGYAHLNNGYDQELERRFEEERPGSTEVYEARPQEIYYIYRWGGTGSYHLSGFGQDGYNQVAVYVQCELEQGRLKQGRVSLNPHWQLDYSKLVGNYLAKL
jgi:hypothetical protein